MKLIIMLLSIMTATIGQTVDYNWAGVGSSCGDLLQNCVANVADGDTIYINTNGPIDENISSLSKAVSLVAGIGYRPVFSEGNDIFIYADGQITVKGLTLAGGTIKVQGKGQNDLSLEIKNNIVVNHLSSVQMIAYTNSGEGTVSEDINISYNQIINNGSEVSSAITFAVYNDSADVNIEVYGNTIEMINGIGISVANISLGNTEGSVVGNLVETKKTGIYVIANEGSVDLDIVSNAIICAEVECPQSSGVTTSISDETSVINLDILNNTVIAYSRGISLYDGVGTLTGHVYNNLIANTINGGINQYISAGSVINNDYNLIFQNGSGNANYIEGTNDMVGVDPMLDNFGRLMVGSPAIDAADPTQITIPELPYVDADGLYREKDGDDNGSVVLDIGAFEFGNITFNHVHSGDFFTATDLDHASTNGLPDLNGLLQVTSIFNLDGTAFGNQNLDNEALFYNGGTAKWSVFNQGEVDMLDGAAFNVLNLAKSFTTFEHKVTAEANFTMIDKTGLNTYGDKVLQVTQHWDGSTSAVNPHPIGVSYSTFMEKWRIFTLDTGDMPINTNFNVYYQDESKSAWKHQASLANRNPGHHYTTLLDHPMLNGNLCAQIQVTQDLDGSIYNNTPIGVWYDNITRKWNIFNQDYTPMPVGATFHVLINPAQIDVCSDLIFNNSFD